MSALSQRKIVVVVGGGDGWLAALDLAAAEAGRRRLPLWLWQAHPVPEGADRHTTLSTMLRRACAAWPDLSVTGRSVTGDPAEVLIEASRTATMVVVTGPGPADHHGPGRAPVWARVAAHAYCPTLVVPPEPLSWPDGPVLVGVGMTGEDEPAIGFGFEEADVRGVPLLAAHVWSGIPASALASVNPYAYDLSEARSAADRTLAETLAGWADKYPDVPVERMPMYDVNPARTLCDASGLAGLAVVGARRHGRRSSQLLGSVTRALIERAACPVAVVRPGHPA